MMTQHLHGWLHSPLHKMAVRGTPEAAWLLLEAGADPQIPDEHGKTAEWLANHSHNPEVAHVLHNWIQAHGLNLTRETTE